MIAICANLDADTVGDFIAENYADYSMKFGLDLVGEAYYFQLGGATTYPMTLILDENGVIVAKFYDKVSYGELESIYLSITENK